jgi:DinB superfamily
METWMKVLVGLMMLGLMAAPVLQAQSVANPVVTSSREIFDRQSAYMVAAAELMPADKYSYHPMPEQWTYGKIIAHVAQVNGAVCGILSDTKAPAGAAFTETSPKADLVAALKASFDFCGKALDGLKDSQLGDTITYFGGAKKPRARALVELTDDLEDHYSQMASYLRMNGMIPPSVKPKK